MTARTLTPAPDSFAGAAILHGRRQVPFRHAVRSVLGRGVRDRDTLIHSLAWGIGFGTFSFLAARNAPFLLVFGSSLALSFAIGYLSPIFWRWRLVPRHLANPWRIVLNNGVVALAAGWLCHTSALWTFALLGGGGAVLSIANLKLFSRIGLWSFPFVIVGMYITMGQDAESVRRRLEREAERRERLLEEARLVALRAQINPHFFFNALNTIASLIPNDPAAAERAVELLAEALRPVLMRDQAPTAALSQELRVARAYAEIEKLRFRDRVTVNFHIDPETESRALPSLCLQPLLENAFRHGAGASAEPHRIDVRTSLDESGAFHLWIENAPAGDFSAALAQAHSPVTPERGHALHNVRTRLRALFGAGADVQVRIGAGAAVAQLSVPPPSDSVPVATSPAVSSPPAAIPAGERFA